MLTKEEIAEIKAANKKPPERVIPRKLEVLKLSADGMKNKEIAEHTEYHVKYVSLIICNYKRKGIEEICDKRPGGNNRTFTEETERELFREIKIEAQDGRYPRLKEIKESVEGKAGKSIARSTFYNMAHRQKGRKVKPRGQNPRKASEEEITESKKK